MNKIGIYLIVLFLLVSNVTALTGSIGNARVVISEEVTPDEPLVIERSILVKNINDVPVNIVLEPDPVYKPLIEFIDREFELQAGESKDARFIITVTNPGFYDGSVNVFFTSIDEEGPGVVLASSIILTAYGEGDFPETTITEEEDEEEIVEEVDEEIVEEVDEEEGEGVSVSVSSKKEVETTSDVNPYVGTFIVLLILALGLSVFYLIKGRKTK